MIVKRKLIIFMLFFLNGCSVNPKEFQYNKISETELELLKGVSILARGVKDGKNYATRFSKQVKGRNYELVKGDDCIDCIEFENTEYYKDLNIKSINHYMDNILYIFSSLLEVYDMHSDPQNIGELLLFYIDKKIYIFKYGKINNPKFKDLISSCDRLDSMWFKCDNHILKE